MIDTTGLVATGVCGTVSPDLDTVADGAADGVVGVTLTTCEGDCAGTEFVDVVPAAVCCDDGVDGGDDATGGVPGVDVAAGPVVAMVVVASVAEGLALEVASGGDDSVDDDAPDTEAEPPPVVADEPGVNVALGSRVATLAFSWLT